MCFCSVLSWVVGGCVLLAVEKMGKYFHEGLNRYYEVGNIFL